MSIDPDKELERDFRNEVYDNSETATYEKDVQRIKAEIQMETGNS